MGNARGFCAQDNVYRTSGGVPFRGRGRRTKVGKYQFGQDI